MNKIIIPIYGFIKSGGVRVITNLANEWAKIGYEVRIITTSTEEPYYPFDKMVKIIRLKAKNKIEKFYKVEKYIENNCQNNDVIIATFFLTAYPVYFALRKKHDFSKGVYYIQAYEPEFNMYGGSLIMKKIAEISYKLPLKHVVNSPLYFNYKACQASCIVPPGLDLKLYCPKDLNFFNKVLKVGCIGRTEKWKGTQDVCNAIKILKKEGFPVEFFIAFNDNNTVEHTFLKPDGDINLSSFYRNMDIVVAPGTLQLGAIHYPVIESMAVGSTIITTDYYPADDNNSYRVPCHSPEKIAETIKQIDKNRHDAVIKRKKALDDVQQFSWGNVSKKFLTYLLGE